MIAASLMSRRFLRNVRITAILLALAAPVRSPAAEPEPDLARLKAHVTLLASPEYQGRRGEGGRKAAQYLIDAFQALELEPLFDGQYTQEIPGKEPGEVIGRNIGARLVGRDPVLREEWVIISAHFDHLGVRNGVLYPGADDNASGVAMLLEAARCLTVSAERPRRSVMFVGFDLEEIGLFGSRYFAEHPPVPLDKVRLFLTADMIGRSLGGVCDPYVFVIGSEYAPGLRDWIRQDEANASLAIGLLGADVIGTRSDYGPFRTRKIPFLFFSTGENPCYHKPTDSADTLNYPKLEAISRLMVSVLRQAASADTVPRWTREPSYPFSEARTVRDVLRCMLDHRDQLKIGAPQLLLMRNTLRNLDGIIARGSITGAERAAMVRAAQIILVSVL